MCISPMDIKNKHTNQWVTVPCGKCASCLTNRREEWSTRLLEESKDHFDCTFLTLTYKDDQLPYGEIYPSLCKKDIQNFLKRFRKELSTRDISQKIRYYAVGEYGQNTKRPHYHLIIFGVSPIDVNIMEKSWSKGQVLAGNVNIASIKYVAKYHLDKGNSVKGSEPPFTLMSRKPGIGHSYVKKMELFHAEDISRCYVPHNQFKRKMPRYYKDKLYSKEDRERILEINKNRDQSYQNLLDFKKKYPNGNYFESELCNKENWQKKYKTKSTKNQNF